jgi:hypothetical protein
MKTRAEYDTALATVRSVIDEWDPFRFYKMGCPADEYDMEVAAIVRRITHIRSAADAAREIATVFAHYFTPDFTPEACTEVGGQLYAKLREADLLET